MKKNILALLFLLMTFNLSASNLPEFSTAGFYELSNTGREVYSMNLAWRFIKGDVPGMPYTLNFDDSGWEVVSVPHGLEYFAGGGQWLCKLSGHLPGIVNILLRMNG